MSPRTPNALAGEVLDALVASGLDAHVGDEVSPGVWALTVDGTDVLVQPYRHPGARPAAAAGGPVALVEVADRVPDWRRAELRDQRAGWLDRRGHLRLWAPRLKVELSFAPAGAPRRKRHGDVRLEVALWALTHPGRPVGVRAVARGIERSPAQVSAVVTRWEAEGLVDRQRRPDLETLLWALVDVWPADGWIRASADDLDRAQAGAAVLDVGDDVATRHGAQLGAGTTYGPGHRYVTDPAAWSRLVRVVEGRVDGTSDGARDWYRQGPARWLPRLGVDAHPVVVALRLAAGDRRGREVVEAWDVVGHLERWALA